ncbi:MAG: hypothetical protein EBT39_06615, partial [Sphingobacteriia bacterium]|nr:hypothetical protein [Candidatus Fonsibacter lacus]
MQWTDEDGVTRNPMIISVIDKAKKMIKLYKRNDNVGTTDDINEVATIVYDEITPLGKNGCVIEINTSETPKKSQLPDNDRGISSTDESTDVDGKITPVIPDGKNTEEVVTEVKVATENKTSVLPTTQPSTSVEVKEVIPQYGVIQASTNPTKEFDNKLVNAISDNIKKNAYVENGSSTANLMFSYGWQWKGNNTKKVTGEKLKVQPAQVDFNATGKLQPIKPYYFYDSKYNDGTPVPNIKELDFLKKHIEKTLGKDMSNYDIALNNIYTKGTKLFRHTDIDESNTAKDYPVVVYVLGNEHKVRVDDNGGKAVRGAGQMVNPKTLTLHNGDIYTFGMDGKGRFEAVHDVIEAPKTDSSFP